MGLRQNVILPRAVSYPAIIRKNRNADWLRELRRETPRAHISCLDGCQIRPNATLDAHLLRLAIWLNVSVVQWGQIDCGWLRLLVMMRWLSEQHGIWDNIYFVRHTDDVTRTRARQSHAFRNTLLPVHVMPIKCFGWIWWIFKCDEERQLALPEHRNPPTCM